MENYDIVIKNCQVLQPDMTIFRGMLCGDQG